MSLGRLAEPLVTQHVVSTPPAEEPLTLDEAKVLAGVVWDTGDPREAMVTGFIAAARDQVERDTQLPLLTQTIDLSLRGVQGLPAASGGSWWGIDVYPWPGPPDATIALVRAPGRLQSVTWVESLDDAGTTVTLDPATYRVDTDRGTIAPLSGSWPSTRLAVRYVAGWTSAAGLKTAVPLLVHALGLLVAHYMTLGRDLAVLERGSLLTIPQGYQDAIASFAPVTLA
jgi:hypothetical protein